MNMIAELDDETFTLQLSKTELALLSSTLEYAHRLSNKESLLKMYSQEEIDLASKIVKDADEYLLGYW